MGVGGGGGKRSSHPRVENLGVTLKDDNPHDDTLICVFFLLFFWGGGGGGGGLEDVLDDCHLKKSNKYGEC